MHRSKFFRGLISSEIQPIQIHGRISSIPNLIIVSFRYWIRNKECSSSIQTMQMARKMTQMAAPATLLKQDSS